MFFSYNLFISWQIYFTLTHNVALVKTFTLICHIVTFHLCWKIQNSGFNAGCSFPSCWNVCVCRLHEAMPYVVKQLQVLWCSKMIKLLFLELIEYVDYARGQDMSRAADKDKGKAFNDASIPYNHRTLLIFRSSG